MNPPGNSNQAGRSERLLTFRSGGWVIMLAILLPIVYVGALYFMGRHNLSGKTVGDGRHIDTYGFDLSTLLVPRDLLATAGPELRKDGLPAPTKPATVRLSEMDERAPLAGVRNLISQDRVIGVEIDGQARAYPLWVMAWHEIVNDDLGGTPITVTYDPLCDSVVVFDRRVAGETLQFGVSGLLFNSNMLMFDRRPDAAGESLWSQLQFRAIAGPAAKEARTLAIVPAELVPWGQWRGAHPNTSIMAPNPARRLLYKSNPYVPYLRSERLYYPVSPLPPANGPAIKALIVARKTDGGWKVMYADSDTTGGPASAYSLWFAWYAMRPDAVLATP